MHPSFSPDSSNAIHSQLMTRMDIEAVGMEFKSHELDFFHAEDDYDDVVTLEPSPTDLSVDDILK